MTYKCRLVLKFLNWWDMYIDIASRYSPYITMSRRMDKRDVEDMSNVAMTKKIILYFEGLPADLLAELELVLKKAKAWLFATGIETS